MTYKILQGNCIDQLKTIDSGSIQTCVTSPPYRGLRDYGVSGQLGLEPTPEEYVANMVEVFREVKRVLRDDGTVWLNLGDSYYGGGWKGSQTDLTDTKQGTNAGTLCGKDMKKDPPHKIIKPKDLVGIPWSVAFALRADGWYLRQDIVWHKPNPMPESVTDRCTKAHEYIFLLSKSSKYYYDAEAVKEPTITRDDLSRDRDTTKLNNTPGRAKMAGLKINDYGTRNKRSVWTVSTQPYKEAHFATFPPKLIEPCVLAGSSYKACEVCGGAWERVMEKGELSNQRESRNHMVNVIPGHDKPSRMNSKNMEVVPKEFTGWQPTCKCENNGTGKSIVLDPFVGSGTTLMVAEDNGRDSIGIELNPEYCELIKQRMNQLQPRLFFEGVQ